MPWREQVVMEWDDSDTRGEGVATGGTGMMGRDGIEATKAGDGEEWGGEDGPGMRMDNGRGYGSSQRSESGAGRWWYVGGKVSDPKGSVASGGGEGQCMHIIGASRCGAITRETLFVSSASRNLAPLVSRCRSHGDAPWAHTNGHPSLLMASDRTFMEPGFIEYPAPSSRSILHCRIVTFLFLMFLISRHALLITIALSGDYSAAVFGALSCITGVLFSLFAVVRADTSIQRWERHEEVNHTMHYLFRISALITSMVSLQKHADFLPVHHGFRFFYHLPPFLFVTYH
ncbi:hypothetical protein Droror1_Dr00016066 [Drosera rotundifolia]